MTEARYSLTTKVSGELYTVRGDTWQEFSGNLDSALFEIQRVSQFVDAVHAVNNLTAAGVLEQPAPAVAQQGPPPSFAPQPAPAAAPGGWPQGPAPTEPPAPTCVHGPRKYVTGQSAKGPWKAWMCPTPKGTPGQCAPEWIK